MHTGLQSRMLFHSNKHHNPSGSRSGSVLLHSGDACPVTSRAALYFFSGTGNSLFIARELAKKLSAEVFPISAFNSQDCFEPAADVVGLVFPVYYATNDAGGVPLIVNRFIEKLSNLQQKYLFAVCTHGGNSGGTTIENLKTAVASQGGALACGFGVKMSNHTQSPEQQQKEEAGQLQKLDAVAQYVSERKTGGYETRSRLGKIVKAPVLALVIKPIFSRRFRKLAQTKNKAPFPELVPNADKSFAVNQNCTGCGICAKVCPVGNIRLENGKPTWLHHCETCFACYSWCPREAIDGETARYNSHYRHPKVKLSNFIGHDQ